MARAASLRTEFLGLCFYLHRRGGVLGCGPEALPSERGATATRSSQTVQLRGCGRILEKTSGEGRVGAGLGAEASGLRETLALDSLGLAGSEQGELQSPFCGFLCFP